MTDINDTLRKAHDLLNEAYDEYSNAPSTLARQFYKMKLQACIFQYGVCAEMVSLNNGSSGFARKVALKGLIHQLFEYCKVSKQLVKRAKDLSAEKGFDVSDSNLRAEARKWREQFQKLEKWSEIRNRATGHYDKNTDSQIKSLETIDPEQVMAVSTAFLSYNMELLKFIREVGRQQVPKGSLNATEFNDARSG